MSEESQAQAHFLRKKQRVGSSGTSVHYKQDERVFSKKDMPDRAREARGELMRQQESDKKRWHSETNLGKHSAERRSTEIFAFDPTEWQYNFRAEKLPTARPIRADVWGRPQTLLLQDGHFKRTQEMPIHPEVADKPWNDTSTIDRRANRAIQAESTRRQRTQSATRSARILIDAEGRGRNMVTLVGRETHRMAELRYERAAEAATHTVELDLALAERSLAWEPKVSTRNAVALREVIVPAVRPLPLVTYAKDAVELEYAQWWTGQTAARARALSSTHHKRVAVKHKHTGAYGPLLQPAQLDADDSDGEEGGRRGMGWSCCGADQSGAQGCVRIEVNLDKYQLEGI